MTGKSTSAKVHIGAEAQLARMWHVTTRLLLPCAAPTRAACLADPLTDSLRLRSVRQQPLRLLVLAAASAGCCWSLLPGLSAIPGNFLLMHACLRKLWRVGP